MTLKEAVGQRHSVRQYIDKPLTEDVRRELSAFLAELNDESGLNMQLVCDEGKAFDSFMAHYGKFSGVKNYIALVGKKSGDLQEKCGYFGQKAALRAQQLGLNTCWVALTYKKVKGAFNIGKGEKLVIVIALGYGATCGTAHHSKSMEEVFDGDINAAPQWFKEGAKAALLAPTAMNQQKFKLLLNGDKWEVKAFKGFYTKIDAGIVKCNFEIGADKAQ